MKTISITPSCNLDLDKLNEILIEHDITRNALVNRFLLMVVNGQIDLKEFLDSGGCNESGLALLNERINILERRASNTDEILSQTITKIDNISDRLVRLKNAVEIGKNFQDSNHSYILENERKIHKIKQEQYAKMNEITNRLNTLETSFNY